MPEDRISSEEGAPIRRIFFEKGFTDAQELCRRHFEIASDLGKRYYASIDTPGYVAFDTPFFRW